MSVVNFTFDLNSYEITIVPNKVWCVSCNVQAGNFENATKCNQCLCIDCMNKGVSGVRIPIRHTKKSGWVYFVHECGYYTLRDASLFPLLQKMNQNQITLVPSPLYGYNRLPNCVRCHDTKGKKETAQKLGRQYCWDCLVALK